MTNLKRIKLLFKAKTQPANNNSDQGRDVRHNTKVDRQMHSGYTKITNLVKEYLKKKRKKKKKEKGMVGT
jgi:hypothetical protein